MVRWLTLLIAFLPGTAAVRADGHPRADDAKVEQVKGYGQNPEEAQRDARVYALGLLKMRLAAHDPPLLAWQPTLADIDRCVQGRGVAGPTVEDKLFGVRQLWVLPVRFPSDEELVVRDLRVRRLWLTWEGFGASMCVLGVYVFGASVRRIWRYRREQSANA